MAVMLWTASVDADFATSIARQFVGQRAVGYRTAYIGSQNP